jgi:hypothetical protein
MDFACAHPFSLQPAVLDPLVPAHPTPTPSWNAPAERLPEVCSVRQSAYPFL